MHQYPIHAVLVATDDINKNIYDFAMSELFLQGSVTLKNRKKYLEKTKCVVKNDVFCLNSEKRSISKIKNELTISGSVLYIVGHHEHYGHIGPSNTDGLTPEELADKLANELDDCISKINCVQFYVCNSMFSVDNDINNSYCGKFYKYMQTKYHAKNLIVGGFIGFLFEDPKHKHTYVSQNYNDYKKKARAEKSIIYIGSPTTITKITQT